MSTAPRAPVYFAPALPITVALVLVLNTAVALVMFLLPPDAAAFFPVWVHSQAIGLSITAVAMSIGHLKLLQRLSPIAALLAMLLPAAPAGYLIGGSLTQALLGRPTPWPLGQSMTTMVTAALLATLLATTFVGYVLWIRHRLQRESAERAQAQRLATEAELRLLRAQLEPHMLFNTLANLRELMGEDPTAAQSMLDSLITYLRGALAASRRELTTLEQEFAQLGAYLALMQVRMGPRLTWHAELPAELRATLIPPMLLQPLVENAIRHGLEPQVGAGSIELRAERDGPARVRVTVSDTGLGLAPLPVEKHAASVTPDTPSSYGLEHVRERLRSVFGGTASLSLEPNSPRGVCASVRIPG